MIVCNASPLIALANLERLDLLDRLFHEWCVPEHVASECTVDRKPFATRLKAALSGHVLTVDAPEPVRSLRLVVDRGEAEVIALAEALHARHSLGDGGYSGPDPQRSCRGFMVLRHEIGQQNGSLMPYA